MKIIKNIKVNNKDGSSEVLPVGADAVNIDLKNGKTVEGAIEDIDNEIIKTKPYIFDTVADMKKASLLKNGDNVMTSGYYNINDGGSATYKITNVKSETEYQEDLGNGLYATLIIKNNIINIKQIGARGNAIQDDTFYFKKINKINAKIFIPDGEYIITDILDFNNKFMFGEINSTINCKKQLQTREHQIRFYDKNIIKNITFIQNHAGVLTIVENSYDTIFDNCKFIVNGFKTNGYFDLYKNNHNIKIKNCYFEINSIENNIPQIGGVWVRQMTSDTFSDNIIFENCDFNTISSIDESIAIWSAVGKISNVNINNCHFYSSNDNANCPFITRLDGETNVKFNNCIFDINNNNFGKSGVFRNLQKRILPKIQNCIINTNHNFLNGLIIGYVEFINNTINSTDEINLFKVNDKNFNSIIRNCLFNLKNGISIKNTSIYNTLFNINGSINLDYNILLKNVEINGLIVPNNKLINQTEKDMDYWILENVNIILSEKNVNELTYFIFNGNHLINNFIINNSSILGQLSQLGDSKGYVINNTIKTVLNTFTNIKQNNNFII